MVRGVCLFLVLVGVSGCLNNIPVYTVQEPPHYQYEGYP